MKTCAMPTECNPHGDATAPEERERTPRRYLYLEHWPTCPWWDGEECTCEPVLSEGVR